MIIQLIENRLRAVFSCPDTGTHAVARQSNTIMSKEITATQETTAQAGGFVPITTQATFDEAIKARVTRERAKYARGV